MNPLPTSVKEIKRPTSMLILLFLLGVATTAQAQTLTIGSVEACAAPEVFVPITGDNLVNIGSITLFIAFDSTRMSYLSIENIDPQLNGSNYSLNMNPFQLAFVWSRVIPIDFTHKKLFDIRFAFKGDVTPVAFKTNCEISNYQLQVLPVNYVNGSVASSIPQVILQPKDTVVKSWALTTFSTIATNSPNYSWKESTNNGQTWNDLSDNTIYQGTHSNELTINYAPPSFNKNRYLCSLSTQNCTAATMQAILTIDTLASVAGYAIANDFLIHNKPNPFNEVTIIEYSLPENGNVMLEILDMRGNIVARPIFERQAIGAHNYHLNASALNPGIYLYRLSFTNANTLFTVSRKMIKQIN